MQRQSNSRTIYSLFAEHWFISTIIIILAMIIDVYLKFSAVNSNKSKLISICLIVFVFIFSLIRNFAISINEVKKENTDRYFQFLLETDGSLKQSQKEVFLDIISNNEYPNIVKKSLTPYNNPASRINPYRHIKVVCRNIEKTLVHAFDTDSNDVCICIFYINTIDRDDNKWEVLYRSYNKNEEEFNMVLMERDTAFALVKDEIGKTFFREKSIATLEFHYRPSEYEKNNGINGSIFCKNITIQYEKIKLPLVLCISTYKSRICSYKDEYARIKAIDFFEKVTDDIQFALIEMMLYKHMGFSEKFIAR